MTPKDGLMLFPRGLPKGLLKEMVEATVFERETEMLKDLMMVNARVRQSEYHWVIELGPRWDLL